MKPWPAIKWHCGSSPTRRQLTGTAPWPGCERATSFRGWQEYEWRWKRKQTPPRPFHQPVWDGSPLGGRTILTVAARLALGSPVAVEAERSLVALGATVAQRSLLALGAVGSVKSVVAGAVAQTLENHVVVCAVLGA